MTLTDFLTHFDKPEKRKGYWQVVCPSHADSTPSLSVKEEDGKILLRCHAGCCVEDIVLALKLKLCDLFVESKAKTLPPWERIEKVYPYIGLDGRVKYESVRLHSPKDFSIRRKVGGRHEWSLGGEKPLPYNLPHVLETAAAGGVIYIPEGEKDADALIERGVCATTNHGGAKKWTSSHAEHLKGAALVVVIEDKDKAGREHGEVVRSTLEALAIPHKTVEARSGKDASDHFASGHTLEEFVDIEPLRAAPAPRTFNHVPWSVLKTRPPKPMLIEGLIGEGDSVMIYGPPKAGKTFVIADLLLACVCGGVFAGGFQVLRPLNVAYCTNEGTGSFHMRIAAAIEHGQVPESDVERRLFYFEDLPQLYDAQSPYAVEAFVEDWKSLGVPLDIFILDTLNKAALGSEENSNSEAAIVLNNLRSARRELGCASALVHHSGRQGEKGRGASAYDGDLDLQLRVEHDEESNYRSLQFRFAKDLEGFPDIGFRLKPVAQSCAVSWIDGFSSEKGLLIHKIVTEMQTAPSTEWWGISALAARIGEKSESIKTALYRESTKGAFALIEKRGESLAAMFRLRGKA